MMINNLPQLNNINIYKPQSRQKIPNLSFKADSVEISDKEKNKDKKTITILSLLLCLVTGMYFGSFFESIVKKTKCGGCR